MIDFAIKAIAVGLISIGLSMTQAKLDGPFGICKAIRVYFNVDRSLEDKVTPEEDRNWIQSGVDCQYCLSLWFSIIGAFVMGPNSIVDFVRLSLVGFGIAFVSFLRTGYYLE